MNHKRVVPLLIALTVLLSLVLAACGSAATAIPVSTQGPTQAAESTAPAVSPTAAAESTAAPAASPTKEAGSASTAEPITLVQWHSGGEGFEPAAQEALQEFHATFPNVKVEMQYVDANVFLERALAAAAAGKLPDVLYTNPQWSASLIDKDIMLPLDVSILGQENLDQNVRAMNELYPNKEGKQVFVPFLGGAQMWYYRTDFAKEAGVEKFPTTWDEWIDWAKKLTKYDSAGNIVREGIGWRLDGPADNWVQSQFRMLLLTQGADILDKTGTKAAFGGPEGLKALQFMHDTIWKYKVSLPLSKQHIDSSGMGSFLRLTRGTAASNYMGAWGIAVFAKLAEDKAVRNAWNVSYGWPKPEGGTSVTEVLADGWGVPKTSKHPKEAFEWIKYLTSKESETRFVLGYNHPVARSDVMLSYDIKQYFAENGPAAVNELDLWKKDGVNATQVQQMHHPKSPEIDKALQNRFIPALENPNADLAAVLKAAEEDVNAILSR